MWTSLALSMSFIFSPANSTFFDTSKWKALNTHQQTSVHFSSHWSKLYNIMSKVEHFFPVGKYKLHIWYLRQVCFHMPGTSPNLKGFTHPQQAGLCSHPSSWEGPALTSRCNTLPTIDWSHLASLQGSYRYVIIFSDFIYFIFTNWFDIYLHSFYFSHSGTALLPCSLVPQIPATQWAHENV